MSSPHLKRARGGALAAIAVVAAISSTFASAIAAPPPPTSTSDALKQYEDLSNQAEQVNEDLLKSQEDLDAKQAELDKATGDMAAAQQQGDQARSAEEEFRGRVDQLTSASFQGARLNQLSALLTSDSTQNFLDQMSALDVLAYDNNDALKKLSSATKQTKDAERKAAEAQSAAKDATDAAAKLTAEVAQRKQDLDGQVTVVKQALARLSGADKAKLGAVGDLGSYVGPPGAANTVIQAALAERGKPYKWGAQGPDSYDCSGLTLWAFAKAGISLAHSSRTQYTVGKPVGRDEWQPGDLLFWGNDPASIHHVALYIGEGKIVHASTEGVPVKVDTVKGGGRDYLGAKRVLG